MNRPRLNDFPLNRYAVLDEAHRLFATNHIDLNVVSQVLRSSIDGFLSFHFGDVSIDLSRDYEKSEDSIHISIVVEKRGIRREVSFECALDNLGLWKKEAFL